MDSASKSSQTMVWVMRGLSALSVLYLALISVLAYWSFLYKIVFLNERAFAALYVIASMIFLGLMLVTRKQVLTSVVSIAVLLVTFALIIFNTDRWFMYVPPLVVGIVMFFACGMKETLKTVLGTCFLLLYVVGLVMFFLARMLFGGTIEETILNKDLSPENSVYSDYDMAKIYELCDSSVSPDGKYRYYIADVQDKDRGKVIIYVEPNDLDKHYNLFTLVENGYKTRVAVNSTRGVTPDIQWGEEGEIMYKFGDGEFKTTKIRIPTKKAYLSFLNVN